MCSTLFGLAGPAALGLGEQIPSPEVPEVHEMIPAERRAHICDLLKELKLENFWPHRNADGVLAKPSN